MDVLCLSFVFNRPVLPNRRRQATIAALGLLLLNCASLAGSKRITLFSNSLLNDFVAEAVHIDWKVEVLEQFVKDFLQFDVFFPASHNAIRTL